MIVYGLGSERHTGKSWVVVSGNLASSEDMLELFWDQDTARGCFETHRKSDRNVTLLEGGKVIAQHKSKLYGW